LVYSKSSRNLRHFPQQGRVHPRDTFSIPQLSVILSILSGHLSFRDHSTRRILCVLVQAIRVDPHQHPNYCHGLPWLAGRTVALQIMVRLYCHYCSCVLIEQFLDKPTNARRDSSFRAQP
jgi:hypothetical protein